MIPLLIVGFLVWIVFQTTREKNVQKWRRRYEPLKPVVNTVAGDVRATVYLAKTWPERRRLRRWSAPDDLSSL